MSDDKLIREMNAYYDRRAPWHDEYLSYESNEKMEALLGPIIRRVEEFIVGQDVLEVACGTGIWTQVLTRRARTVVATDVNSSVIEIARRKEYRGAQPAFVVADAYRLDEIESSFDLAFMTDWWTHVPRQMLPSFMEGLHRRLRKNAHVVVIDMMPQNIHQGNDVVYDADGNRRRQRILPDGSQFEVVKNFPTEQELTKVIDPYADQIHYWQDQALLRWVLIYRLRNQSTDPT
ncbi:MAG: class I SAM-dependent methyltransferase [candidate division Zixibacteria bacterium]|nr:class I SAM-dependent methyltransferase [candidate division Zixibacteria bacterium]